MKQLLTLTLLVALSKAYSQNPNGYLFYSNNDSVNANIKIPKGIFGINIDRLYRKVSIEDSTGALIEFTPTEIKGFGFTFKSHEYKFYAKPIENGKYRFLEPVIIGTKTSLYKFVQVPINNSSIQEFYIFEKPGNSYLYLNNFESLKTFREKLKSFYTGSSNVEKYIDGKFNRPKEIQSDLKSLLLFINNL